MAHRRTRGTHHCLEYSSSNEQIVYRSSNEQIHVDMLTRNTHPNDEENNGHPVDRTEMMYPLTSCCVTELQVNIPETQRHIPTIEELRNECRKPSVQKILNKMRLGMVDGLYLTANRRIYVPLRFRFGILYTYHSSLTGCHQGIRKHPNYLGGRTCSKTSRNMLAIAWFVYDTNG